MSKVNPYKPPHSANRTHMAVWKAYLLLNLVLVMIPIVAATGIYAWIILEAWQATRDNHGDPVTYQHFFWIAPSGYLLIVFYFLVPNWILFLVRR